MSTVTFYYVLDTRSGGILGSYTTPEEAYNALEEDTVVVYWEGSEMKVIATYDDGKITEKS